MSEFTLSAVERAKQHAFNPSRARGSTALGVHSERSRGACEPAAGWRAESQRLVDASRHLLREARVALPFRAACRVEARRYTGGRARHPLTCNWPHTRSRNSLKTRLAVRRSNRNTSRIEVYENKGRKAVLIATKPHSFKEKAKPRSGLSPCLVRTKAHRRVESGGLSAFNPRSQVTNHNQSPITIRSLRLSTTFNLRLSVFELR